MRPVPSRPLVAAALAAAVAGCAAMGEAERRIESGAAEAGAAAARAAAFPSGPVARSSDPFLGRQVVRPPATALPEALECRGCFLAMAGAPLELGDVADLVARRTGLAVSVVEGRREGRREREEPTWTPRYRGPLSGFLDAMSAAFDVAWSAAGGRLRIERETTRVYRLAAGAASAQVTTQVSGAVSSGDTGGAQTVSSGVSVDVWSEVRSVVERVFAGGAASVSRTSGTLTVTGPPSAQARARALVRDLDAILEPRVAVKVTLLLVDVTDGDDYGLNIEALFESARAGVSLGVTGLSRETIGAAGALAGGVAVAEGAGGGWSGTADVVARAVSESGRLVDRHQAVVTGRTAAATPVRMATRRNYVRELGVTSDSGVTTYEAQVDTLTTGYSLQLLPRVEERGRVSLYLAVSTANLVRMERVAFGDRGGFLDLPTVSQRVFTLDTTMRTGEALVLAGYDQDRSTAARSGAGTPSFWSPLGGGARAHVRRVRLIAIVEPHVRATPRPRGPAPVLVTGRPA